MRLAALLLSAMVLAGCGAVPWQAPVSTGPDGASRPGLPASAEPRRGAYYKDDGPGMNAPPNLEQTPDAVPRAEPLHRFANRPYEVFGKQYVPVAHAAEFRQRGTASWYGRRYHGQRTSSGEPYDMYAMSAAHPTLPIPSYARVTHLGNGRSVVVRINDRGPFHADRIIDLSYTAALKLGYVEAGSAQVEVETVTPGNGEVVAAQPPAASPPVVPQASAAQPRGVFLQLGAFAARDNAESFRSRVQRDLGWLADTIHVHASSGLFKLQLGPYATAEHARQVADRIRAELSVSPVLVTR